MVKLLHILTLLLTVLSSCSEAQNSSSVKTTKTNKIFTKPTIPGIYSSVDDRSKYLITHYWDNFIYSDTTFINNANYTEQAFVDYINLFPYTSLQVVNSSIQKNINDAFNGSEAMLSYFTELYEKYLYDPNSPFRNEEYYIQYLQHLIAIEKLDELHKIRPRYQLEMALKNRPGDIATDFTYTVSNGRTAKMHNIKADYTILFFNNPDCAECSRTKQIMRESEVFAKTRELGSSKRVVILGVYTDEDIELWRNADYPGFMINTYDQNQVLTNTKAYDLRAIPTLYLLDKNKRVILKDTSIETIEQFLANVI